VTISEQLAREARELTFAHLPDIVVHESKRRVLDTLACAIGGFDSRPSVILQGLIQDLGGRAESTVYGSLYRTSCMNAALVNGVMVRFTEAMDRAIEGRDGRNQHGHPGEVIPGVIAVGEREHSSGKDVITGIVLGYQLLNRLSYAAGGARSIELEGMKHEIRANMIFPLVAGKLMGLTEQQLVNAVGISGCYAGELSLLDHGLEEITMARNLRFPYATYQAILAALMAQRGFEGPSQVYEGHGGFNEVILHGKIDVARLVRRDDDFNILYTSTKAFPVNGRLQGQTEALVRLVTEHRFVPEQVAGIKITTSPRVLEGMGNPSTHRYPQTKETADHSAYFVAALVVIDGGIRLGLDQFTPQRLQDPRVRSVIDKIELVAIPGWPIDEHAPSEVEVTMIDGTTYRCRVDYPKGHVLNPLSDADIEEKFVGMTGRLMSEAQMREVFRVVWNLDELDDIGELTTTLAVKAGAHDPQARRAGKEVIA